MLGADLLSRGWDGKEKTLGEGSTVIYEGGGRKAAGVGRESPDNVDGEKWK